MSIYKNQQPPAQLIVGDGAQLLEHSEQFLQKRFCNKAESGCFCNECRKIKNRQHQDIIWISPEKDYTVDDIQIIFDRIHFTLDPEQSFFFILDNAQKLTTTTANRILKILEEPPQGYHFILLATNAQALLPTIISRCVVVELSRLSGQIINADQHPLLGYFCLPAKHKDLSGLSRRDPLGFEAELKKQGLDDTQSLELLQQLIAFFAQQLRNNTVGNTNHDYVNQVLEFLHDAMRKPPQSGSSDLFWKYLFLSFPDKP